MSDMNSQDDPFISAADVRPEPPVLVAAYDSDCTECGDQIIADLDDIQADGEGGWRHAECP
jgi:hypothetical protein